MRLVRGRLYINGLCADRSVRITRLEGNERVRRFSVGLKRML